MSERISIAIETSCRQGGAALGRGAELVEVVDFDASSRHATQLVTRLRELLTRHGLRAGDLSAVYVSVGPGSFTGVRVGVTVARTLAQAVGNMQCVAVPSAYAVACNAAALPWQHLAVVLDAKEEWVYAQLFTRTINPIGQPEAAFPVVAFGRSEYGWIVPAAGPRVMTMAQLLAGAPRPLVLTGEGLRYHGLGSPSDVTPEPAAGGLSADVTVLEASLHLPRPSSVWHVGQAMEAAGLHVDFHHLLPIYARKSEAERLWDLKHGEQP